MKLRQVQQILNEGIRFGAREVNEIYKDPHIKVGFEMEFKTEHEQSVASQAAQEIDADYVAMYLQEAISNIAERYKEEWATEETDAYDEDLIALEGYGDEIFFIIRSYESIVGDGGIYSWFAREAYESKEEAFGDLPAATETFLRLRFLANHIEEHDEGLDWSTLDEKKSDIEMLDVFDFISDNGILDIQDALIEMDNFQDQLENMDLARGKLNELVEKLPKELENVTEKDVDAMSEDDLALLYEEYETEITEILGEFYSNDVYEYLFMVNDAPDPDEYIWRPREISEKIKEYILNEIDDDDFIENHLPSDAHEEALQSGLEYQFDGIEYLVDPSDYTNIDTFISVLEDAIEEAGTDTDSLVQAAVDLADSLDIGVYHTNPDTDSTGELATEVMTMKRAAKLLDDMKEAFESSALHTTDTTGLHINMSLANRKLIRSEFDVIKLIVLLDDFMVKGADIYGRRFAAGNKPLDVLVRNIKTEHFVSLVFGDLNEWNATLQRIAPRASSLNMGSVVNWDGKMKMEDVNIEEGGRRIEFRYPGGSDYHMQGEEIKISLARIAFALKAAYDPEFRKQEYLLRLQRAIKERVGLLLGMPFDEAADTIRRIYDNPFRAAEDMKRAGADSIMNIAQFIKARRGESADEESA